LKDRDHVEVLVCSCIVRNQKMTRTSSPPRLRVRDDENSTTISPPGSTCDLFWYLKTRDAESEEPETPKGTVVSLNSVVKGAFDYLNSPNSAMFSYLYNTSSAAHRFTYAHNHS